MDCSASSNQNSQTLNALSSTKCCNDKSPGLVQLVFGSWTWITRNGLDVLKQDGWPLVSMTFMYNNDTGEFISRVLHRKYEVGKIEGRKELLAKCETFFEGNYPCLGMNNVEIESEEFPFHLKFSSKCDKLVHSKKNPTYLEGMVCDHCREMQAPRLSMQCESVSETQSQHLMKGHYEIESTLEIIAQPEDFFEIPKTEECQTPSMKITKMIAPKEEPIENENVLENLGRFSGLRKSSRPRKRAVDASFFKDEETSDNNSDLETKPPKKIIGRTRRIKNDNRNKLKHVESKFDPNNYYVEWEEKTLVLDMNIAKDMMWACPICRARVKGHSKFSHLKTHLLFRTPCGICGLPFLCPGKLWDHFQKLHVESDEWWAKCGICQKTLNIKESRDSLGDHLAACSLKQIQDGSHKNTSQGAHLEVIRPSNYLVEYQTKLFTLEGKIPPQEMWSCPICPEKVKGFARPSHLSSHGKFWVRCEICLLTHFCALKLWDHYTVYHQDAKTWKGKCGQCSTMVDMKKSRDTLQNHYLDCLKSVKTNDSSKELCLPSQFVVEWDGKDTIMEGHVEPFEQWTCPICSLVMLGKQRMLHLRIHFLLCICCGFCQTFHLCPRKLWDHHQDQHIEHKKWLVNCVTCKQKIDIKPSRDTFREHLMKCLESPRGKSKTPSEKIMYISKSLNKQILSAPQKLSFAKSFEVEWMGKTITIPEKDPDSSWMCPLCEKDVKERITHLKNKHNLYQVPCGICGIYLMCPYKLWDHMQESHAKSENWPFQCPICNDILDIKGSRDVCRDHLIKCVLERRKGMLRKRDTTKYPIRVCETCGKTFKKRYNLLNHIKEEHQNMKPKCPVCSVEVSFAKLNHHMKVAHHATKFTCPMCFKNEKFALTFWEHLRDNHLDRIKEYTCPVCKKDFPINPEDGPKFVTHHEECFGQYLNKLKEGEKKRMKARPKKFPCPTCPKSFQAQYLLNAHMRTHKGIGQCCHLCKYRTHSAAYLRAHMHEVHGDTSDGVKCEYCLVNFMTHASLEAHLDSSHGIKAEHQCDLCPLKLPSKLHLKNHKRDIHPESVIGFDGRSNQLLESRRDESEHFLCPVCQDTYIRSKRGFIATLEHTSWSLNFSILWP